jgi:hypothetical protein
MRWLLSVGAVATLLAGCGADDASNLSEQGSMAICGPAQVRFNGATYHGWDVTTEPRDAKAGVAEWPVCEDVGRHATGSYYRSDPDPEYLVNAWKFKGYPTSEVIGIRRSYELELYVVDDVTARRAETILAELGETPPSAKRIEDIRRGLSRW